MRRLAVFPLIGILALASCASAGNFARVDDAAKADRFADSAEMLEAERGGLYSPARDAVLYYLDKGMLTHYANQYEESAELLGVGERAIEAAFTKSVTRGVGSYLLNDTVLEYAGEDYEDIYLNAFNALNYYRRGDSEGALVEVRRMNNKLLYLADKYNTALTDLQKQAIESGAENLPENPNAPSLFANSALARYLGMLFYRADGLADDARIDNEGLRLAFANAPAVYAHPVPSSIAGDLEIPAGKARVNIIALSGLAPVKQEITLRIPLPGPRWVKIALPELAARPSAVSRIEAVFADGTRAPLELLEDMSAVAAETFKNKQNFIYAKSITRAVVKGISSSAMAAAAESEDVDAQTSGILSILSLATQVFAEVSEQADLRVSRYFPGKAWVGAVNLDPGVYSFRVDFYNAAGALVASRQFSNVDITEDNLNLFEAVCLR